jgi:hypothetical protein
MGAGDVFCMESVKPTIPSIARDIFLVTTILAIINYFLSIEDLGWMQLNPSPWLLLPILIGCKYGLGPGVAASVLAGLTVIAGEWVLSGKEFLLSKFFQAHVFYFIGLILVGFLCGAFRSAFGNRYTQASHELEQANVQVNLLKSEVEIVHEGRNQLQRELLLHNSHLACLDLDLKKLFVGGNAQLLQNLLAVMNKHTGLISAAFYVQQGSALQRLAVLHETPALKAQLPLSQTPLAAEALRESQIVSVEAPVGGSVEQPFLAALPFNWKGKEGVLMVQNMPLRSYDWQHLSILEIIMKWAFSLDTLRDQRKKSGDPNAWVAIEDFIFLLHQSLETEQKHQLPSAICRADFLDPKEAQDVALLRRLLKAMPATAVPTFLPQKNCLLALLPFGGEAEASALARELEALGATLRTAVYSVVKPLQGPMSAQDFWAVVTKD